METMGKSFTLYDLFNNRTTPSFKVVFNDIQTRQIMSYEDVCSSVSQLAEVLKSFVVAHSVVGCLIKPGLSLPIVTLGISKISSPFTFLEVHTPLNSLTRLQKYVPVQNLLVEENILTDMVNELCSCWKKKGKIVLNNSNPLVFLHANHCNIEKCPQFSKSYPNFTNPSKLAYIIQTSGTTGEPKIVQVPHQCIVPNIIDLKSRFSVTSKDVMLLCAPLTFDPSIVEMFLAITSGCTLVIIPDYVKSIPRMFLEVFRDSLLTIIQATPSLILSLGEISIREILLSDDSCLRILAFGGEDCPSHTKLKNLKSSRNETRIFNLYGLTEISCWASIHEIDFNEYSFPSGIPLGKPLLETDMELGQNGELYVGGHKRWCVINNEPWHGKESNIMRATGDLVIKDSNAHFYYSGRKDSIFKFNGQKINLQEINSALESIKVVINYCVHYDWKTEKLFLFVVLQERVKFQSEIKREVIKEVRKSILNLPVIEVVPVSHIPLTKHGKANRAKLLQLLVSESHQNKTAADAFCNRHVEFISKLWKDYTNQQTITDADNFILAGGNSFSSLQFTADIETEFHISIPELVDRILNQSFRDVVELVRTYLPAARNTNCDIVQQSVVSLEESPCPSSKRMCIDRLKCYQVSSRRGDSLRCSGLCEHAHDITTKPKEDSNITLVMKGKFHLKKCVDASPCAVHFFQTNKTFAFIGSHSGIFCCIDVEKDILVWSLNLPDRIESSACLSYCGNYVFVGCYDHHVYCFDISTGKVQWKFSTNAEVKSSPVVSSQNIVYVGSHDKSLYALVAESGELMWKKQISKGSIFSSPWLSDTLSVVIVASLDGVIAALKMDSGATIWSYNYRKPLFSSPLCSPSLVFIGSTDNVLLQFELKSGALTRHYPTTGSVFSSPILGSSANDEQIIFGCHDCHVYCINSKGESIWKFQCDSSVYATPFAFQWTQKEYVVIASTSGTIYILNQRNGDVKCTWNCPGQIFSSPVILKNFLIVGCRDNFVYCLTLSAIP